MLLFRDGLAGHLSKRRTLKMAVEMALVQMMDILALFYLSLIKDRSVM